MKDIKTELLVCCDVDYTLFIWGGTDHNGRVVEFINPYNNERLVVAVNEANLKVFTNWLARGATGLVWSRSGQPWAEAALKALKLEHDRIITGPKPIVYIDDKPCQDWMGERVFLSPDDPWGTSE